AALSGVINGDTVDLSAAGAAGAFTDKNVGTNKVVNISGLTLSGADAGNYALTQPSTTASITARPITVTADAQIKTYGDADPTLTYRATSRSLLCAASIS